MLPPTRMAASNGSNSQERTFGYLSVVKSAEHGYFGGYLIVCGLGRPLEFHCTAPIRPSRAQQILYGPTLEPYLAGEQICGALLEIARLKPTVILTDCEAAFDVRARFAIPMAMVVEHSDASITTKEREEIRDADDRGPSGPRCFTSRGGAGEVVVAQYHLRLPAGYECDEQPVAAALALLREHVDLAEPFSRIQEAIREAQRLGGRGTEAHEQAA